MSPTRQPKCTKRSSCCFSGGGRGGGFNKGKAPRDASGAVVIFLIRNYIRAAKLFYECLLVCNHYLAVDKLLLQLIF